MKTLSRPGVLLLGIVGFGSIAWGQCNTNACNQCCPERRTIAVTGTAQVTADADLAVVRVGYKLYGPDAKTAYASAVDTSNAIMQALTGSGIQKSAIESTSQVLQHALPFEAQQYQWTKDEREARQFTITQSWIIRVKPEQAGAALSTAVGAGANESGWIQWIVEDPSAPQAKALSEAVANARKIAEEIAAKSGVRLRQLVSVNENQGGFGFGAGYGGSAGGSIFGMGDAVMMAGVNSNMSQQLAINSRRVEFRASVLATFAIEEAGAAAR
jgi:uncharacterized protein